MDDSKKSGTTALNLEDLTGFQFGPAWARGAEESPAVTAASYERFTKRGSGRRDSGEGRSSNRPPRKSRDGEDSRRPERGNGRFARTERRPERPQRELPQPVEGYRVELRPCNAILEIFTKEIHKQKRALPLLDLARVVMDGKERYDLVFMKLENGSMLISSQKGDGACWLTEEEAVAYLWKAPWFSELYTEGEAEVEAPKGNFSAIATCSMGNEIIGPVNWHGYQAALMNLYRSKYSNMPLDAFKSRISLNKGEEAVAAWMEQASKKTIWKPTREGAEDVVLPDTKAVEEDFKANHYAAVYSTVDKVFINGATPRSVLSPGLAAHLAILSDKTRKFPQMLIPNLCHGLARHHMPIYKWQGNHFTGPSRVRSIPEDTVLADRMMAIVNWSKANSGKKVEAMFAELSGVPAGTDDESRKAASDAYAPYAADMIWLLEQGFVVVTGDNSIWYPKGEAAPAPTKVEPRRNNNNKKRPGNRRPRPSDKKSDAPAN